MVNNDDYPFVEYYQRNCKQDLKMLKDNRSAHERDQVNKIQAPASNVNLLNS